VLFLLPGAFLPAGGLEMYNRLLIMAAGRWCAQRGGHVEVLALRDRPSDLDARYVEDLPISYRAFSGSRRRFAAGAVLRALRTQPTIAAIGHVNFASLALAVRAVSSATRQYLFTHGIDVWRRLSPVARASLWTSDVVCSVSQFTAKELCRFNGLRRGIELLPCALDPFYGEAAARAAASAPPVAGQRALAVARLTRGDDYKGIDYAIRAFARIAPEFPDARFDVIGDGDDRGRLENLARGLCVEDRVIFHGRVSTEALARAYADCRFFIMPSAREGFGIVFLEAAIFRRPSIAGNHGGSPEVVRDEREGLLVQHGDVEQTANQMRRLFRDPALAERLGREARSRLDAEFTYPTFERRTFALLDRALAWNERGPSSMPEATLRGETAP
jgi:glycosyltransferase involved in cell wall biosynthesis